MRAEENYDVFYNKIREKYSHREREIKLVNKLLTVITYFAYPAMAAYLFVKGDERFLKVVVFRRQALLCLLFSARLLTAVAPMKNFT